MLFVAVIKTLKHARNLTRDLLQSKLTARFLSAIAIFYVRAEISVF